MKVFVILSLVACFANAFVPPFDTLLSGGLGSILGGLNPLGATVEEDTDQQNTANTGHRFGGIFGNNPRQIAGDVLGVKVNLLSALRDTLLDNQSIDLEGSTAGAAVDGTGVGVSGFGETSNGGASSQAFSAGSAFASMSGVAGESSSGQIGESASGSFGQSSGQEVSAGYSNQQNNLSPPATSYGTPDIGYNYNRPPQTDSGYSPSSGYNYNRPPQTDSGYASNGGYNYNRPQPPPNSYIPPSSGNGHASNGGYNYNRPAPPQNSYLPPSTGSGYSPVSPQNEYGPPPPRVQNTYGPPGGAYASQSSSLDSSSSSISSQPEASSIGLSNSGSSNGNGFNSEVSFSQVGSANEFSSGSSSTSTSDFSGVQATQSGVAGLSASGGGSSSGSAGGNRRHQGIQGIAQSVIRSGVQVPISLLTSYRSGVNRGFDTLTRGIESLQRIFSGGSSADDSSNRIESDSRVDSPPSASFDFDSNDLRRRY